MSKYIYSVQINKQCKVNSKINTVNIQFNIQAVTAAIK